VEAYTVDHRPLWLHSAASLRVKETRTCDEFLGRLLGSIGNG
jgi:hypothetical protein